MQRAKNRFELMVAAVACIAVAASLFSCTSSLASADHRRPAAASAQEQDVGLELRESQSGFAGISGTTWRIAADGTVTISTFLNERESPPSRTGRLDAARLSNLIARFRSAHFEELPESLGSPSPINPRNLRLKFGAKTVVLTLPPTDPEHPEPKAENAQAQRVIDLANKLREAAEEAAHR